MAIQDRDYIFATLEEGQVELHVRGGADPEEVHRFAPDAQGAAQCRQDLAGFDGTVMGSSILDFPGEAGLPDFDFDTWWSQVTGG